MALTIDEVDVEVEPRQPAAEAAVPEPAAGHCATLLEQAAAEERRGRLTVD